MSKKALVTGGTGFVGSHLVRLLIEQGHGVRVLHRLTSSLDLLSGLEYESYIGEVTDLDSLRRACEGCDWVFHVAAVADYWRADEAWMFEVNVEGTRKVLQAAKEANVQRVVFTSSAAAIGIREDSIPADESVVFNLQPEQFPYGYSKVQAEEVVAQAVITGQDVVTVNPVIVIGPDDKNMISGSFIVQIKRFGRFTPMTSGGVSVIDVRDVAQAHISAAEKGKTGERYILSTANYSNQDWFKLIAREIGAASPFLTLPDSALPLIASGIDMLRKVNIPTLVDANQVRLGGRCIYFDASKAHQELGKPQISMRQSIRDTYDWYRHNGKL